MSARESHESTPSRPARAWPWWFFQSALLVLCLLFVWLGARPIAYSTSVISNYPYQLDREEGFLLHQAQRLANGEGLYLPIEEEPYLVDNYTPVYPTVYAAALLFSDPSLGPGRFLVLLAVLGIVILMAGYILLETRSPFPAILAPGLFLATYDLGHWIGYARVDLPAIFFGLAALLAAFRGPAKYWIPVSAVLTILAFYTKQTQIFVPLSILVVLGIQREWRRAGLFLAWSVGGGLLAGLLLLVLTGGRFWLHTVVYNANEFHWDAVISMLRHLWFFARWSILAAVAAAIGALLLFRKSPLFTPPVMALFIYTGFCGISLAGVGKAGSAVNYFLEFHVVANLLTGWALGAFLCSLRKTGPIAIPRVALFLAPVLLLALHGWRMARDPIRSIAFPRPFQQAEAAPAQFLVMELLNVDGEVLSEDIAASLMAGKEVLYQPFIMAQLAREGKWDDTVLVDQIASGRFALILTEKNLEDEYFYGFTKEIRDALLKHYYLDESIRLARGDPRYLYRPEN